MFRFVSISSSPLALLLCKKTKSPTNGCCFKPGVLLVVDMVIETWFHILLYVYCLTCYALYRVCYLQPAGLCGGSLHHKGGPLDSISPHPPRYSLIYHVTETSLQHLLNYPLLWVLIRALCFCSCDLDDIPSTDLHELCIRCVMFLGSINGEMFRNSNICY